MGRTQQFDTLEVVRAARGVFWKSGFEGSSLPELEAATGLKRSSIYHAFESKQGLFEAVIENYLDEVIRPRLTSLAGENVAEDALETYLQGVRAALQRPDTLAASSGCLLVNAASAPIAHDETVAKAIADYRAELRAAIHRGVRARFPAAREGESSVLADACTGLVVAAFSLVRVAPEAAVQSLDAALGLIAREAGTPAE